MSDLKISSDSKIDLCAQCNVGNVPECWPNIKGVEFEFGDGLGEDNMIGCINYDGPDFDTISN